MKRLICVMVILLTASMIISCGKTEYLRVESVETDENGRAKDPDTQDVNLHDLFSNAPGSSIPLFSFSGAIDPVGTSLDQDFDGDGIINENENGNNKGWTGGVTNVWVADYPMIETNIATPVTMKIEILYDSCRKTESISSEIDASDVVKTADRSTESVHRNELNERTVQYQDTTKTSSSQNKVRERSIGAGVTIATIGVKTKVTTKNADSSSQSSEKTETKWKDVPFKNNLQRDGWEQKGSQASKNARQLREDIRSTKDESYVVKPNAGYVRAALYITNESVNMPVRLSNILCSFLLQSPEGALIPVQSFKLRNDDYSLFEIDVYGGNTVGPFVIDLENLNTQEIMDAVNRGYNPKIFIVDYEMNHVEGSNYKKALPDDLQGNNLKIIEENAKGRTAGIKIVGPGLREFFRVVAFGLAPGSPEVETVDGIPDASNTTDITPGITMEKALKRISYSLSREDIDTANNGNTPAIECANFVFDLTGIADKATVNALNDPNVYYGSTVTGGNLDKIDGIERFFVRGIKSVKGIESKFPLKKFDGRDYREEADGTRTYIMKPISDWTADEVKNFKIWVIFDKGKYYVPSDSMKNEDGTVSTYQIADGDFIPKFMGVNSIIWPGDHYDLVYLDMIEYLGLSKEFGKNPFETEEDMAFNTRWNMDDVSSDGFYFYPEAKTRYLGEAAPGDTIEFTIKLDDTYFLNPSFGTYTLDNGIYTYSDFSYNPKKSTLKFNIYDALDFELSFGLGGKYTNWINLFPERSRYSDMFSKYYYDYSDDEVINPGIDPDMLKYSWDFLNQKFIVDLKIPYMYGIGDNNLVKVYLRPALNNAYRESIWPLSKDDVKKFRGILAKGALIGDTGISVKFGSGIPEANETIFINGYGYKISGEAPIESGNIWSIKLVDDSTDVEPFDGLNEEHRVGEDVYVNLASTPDTQNISLVVDDGFETDWNNPFYRSVDPIDVGTGNAAPLVEPGTDMSAKWYGYGFSTSYLTGNWIGNYNYSNPAYNSWSDPKNLSDLGNWIVEPLCLSGATNKQMAIRANLFKSITLLDNSYIINTIKTQNQIDPHVAIAGNRGLVVWSSYENGSSNKIFGRIIDSKTGLAISDVFTVGTDGGDNQSCSQIAISASGTRALVAWYGSNMSTGETRIYGKVVDLFDGPTGTSDLQISHNSSGYQYAVGISGNKALVAWDSYDNNWNWDIYGNVVHLGDANNPLPEAGASDLCINTTTTNNQQYPQVAVSGDRAMVVWFSNVDQSSSNICGNVVDFGGSFTSPVVGTTDFIINTTIANNQYPQIVVSGSAALVVWYEYLTETYKVIRGRFMNVSTKSGINNQFAVSPEDTSSGIAITSLMPLIKASGDRATVIWMSTQNSNNYMFGRSIKFSQAPQDPVFSFNINSIDYYYQLGMAGEYAVITWSSIDSGNVTNIHTRLINPVTGSGSSDLIVNTISLGSGLYTSSVSGGRVIYTWESMENGSDPDIRTRTGILKIEPSNFMVRPLIERDYTVKVQLK